MQLVRALEPEPSSRSEAPDSPEAFAAWVQPQVVLMARLAARLAPIGEGDDVVQEALMRAWSKRRQFDPRRGTPATWLLAITADQARQARRRRRPVPVQIEVVGDSPVRDEHVDVEAAVSRLPPRQRLAIECFYFVGLSVAETAAVMRCSEGTVKSTLSDARARLRPLLEVRDA